MEEAEFVVLTKELFLEFSPDFENFFHEIMRDISNRTSKYVEEERINLISSVMVTLCLRKISRLYAMVFSRDVTLLCNETAELLKQLIKEERMMLDRIHREDLARGD